MSRKSKFTKDQDKELLSLPMGGGAYFRQKMVEFSGSWNYSLVALTSRRNTLLATKRNRAESVFQETYDHIDDNGRREVFARPTWFNEDIALISQAKR